MTAEEGKNEEGDGEKKMTKPPAWMFNDQGVAYAPWMVDAFDPEVLACLPAYMLPASVSGLPE